MPKCDNCGKERGKFTYIKLKAGHELDENAVYEDWCEQCMEHEPWYSMYPKREEEQKKEQEQVQEPTLEGFF